MMKRYIFALLLIMLTINLSAQKAARKAIRDGYSAYEQQLYGKAEEDFKKAKEIDPKSKEASYNLANTYYKQQKWQDALSEYGHYEKIEDDVMKKSAAFGNMGNTFLKMKPRNNAENMPQQGAEQQKEPDYLQLSMQAYKQALRLNPADDALRYNLTVVQKMIDDNKDDGGDDNKDDNKDQDQKKDEKKEDKKDQQQDKKDEKKDQQQQENQMSQENIEQILKAIEQDEKETQERVKQLKAAEREKQNRHNRKQNKDW